MSDKIDQLGGSKRTLYEIQENISEEDGNYSSGVLSIKSKELDQTVNTSIQDVDNYTDPITGNDKRGHVDGIEI